MTGPATLGCYCSLFVSMLVLLLLTSLVIKALVVDAVVTTSTCLSRLLVYTYSCCSYCDYVTVAVGGAVVAAAVGDRCTS